MEINGKAGVDLVKCGGRIAVHICLLGVPIRLRSNC